MPTRLCLAPQCPAPQTYRGRCQRHAKERNTETHQNRKVYNSKRWAMTRKVALHTQPLCPCGEIATDVDHIIPIEQGGDTWARANLQGLCAQCHGRKTRGEQA